MPLIDAGAFGLSDSDVGPHFIVEGRPVVLDPLQIANVPRDVLGPSVASLAGEDFRVVNALDLLLSRAWR